MIIFAWAGGTSPEQLFVNTCICASLATLILAVLTRRVKTTGFFVRPWAVAIFLFIVTQIAEGYLDSNHTFSRFTDAWGLILGCIAAVVAFPWRRLKAG